MKPARLLLVGVLAPLALCAGVLAAAEWRTRGFPHERHERLFPVCEGCHAGMRSGDPAEAYPAPTDCLRCHDGTRAVRVVWQGPAREPGNLRFSHVVHLERTARAGTPTDCRVCHAAGDTGGRMNVGPAEPELCLQCHAHRAQTHLAGSAECSRCHVPLSAAAAIPLDRVARFPTPASHGARDFLAAHGPESRAPRVSCNVCHARESCERCHPNADRLQPILDLPRDARIAALEAGRPPEYPRPATHRGDWTLDHGSDARTEAAACANCHTRPSCNACHRNGEGNASAAIALLADGSAAQGRGVDAGAFAMRVHAPDFASGHGAAVASGSMDCGQCHAPRECAACHSGADSRAFHPLNFLERHATEAFAGSGACRSCHTTESFCRACHEQNGLGTAGMSAAYHDAQPMWVLAHGQAARVGMDGCAACHGQADCTRCHSAAGGWGVNPHGRDFAASRLATRTDMCDACHLGDPRGRE